MSFKNKLLLGFIVYGIVLISVAILGIYNINKSNLKITNIDNAIQKYKEKEEFFNYQIKHIELKLKTLKNSALFKNYIYNDFDEHLHIKDLFLTVAGTSSNIMQLRYLDIDGFEKIRIDRKEYDSKPFVIHTNKLQNKSDRYYFKDIVSKNKNELWYSNIDLNKEKGKIEKPIKPVLRVGTPVFKDNKKVGILIINIFMKELLEKFSQASLYDIYLIDKDGDFIANPDYKECWNKYLNNNHNIKNHFGKTTQNILNNNIYKDKKIYVQKLNFNNNDNLKVIIKPKIFYMQKQVNEQTEDLLIVMFAVLLLSIPFAYLFAKTPAKLKEELDNLNKTLEQKEKFSNTVIESNINAIIVINEEQIVLVFNKAAEDMFGYTKEEMLYKKSLDNIIPEHYRDKHHYGISNFLNEKKSKHPASTLHEVEGKRKNGEIFPILIGLGTKVENDHILIAANISDITKYNEQKEQIKRKDQIMQQQSKMAQMGEMVGSIAHQWRQPLNEIGINIQKLKYDYKSNIIDENFIKKFIDKNKQTINFMSKTIDDFRNFFRVDKDKENFSIKSAIKNTISMQSSQLNNYNIVLNITGDDFKIDGFQNEFRQVILNLVNNAKDALIQNKIKNPTIDIILQNNTITVKDNAGGIPEDILNRVFEPYFTTKEQGSGTGMGLYMSKMIIENNMGGVLSASNINIKNQDDELASGASLTIHFASKD